MMMMMMIKMKLLEHLWCAKDDAKNLYDILQLCLTNSCEVIIMIIISILQARNLEHRGEMPCQSQTITRDSFDIWIQAIQCCFTETNVHPCVSILGKCVFKFQFPKEQMYPNKERWSPTTLISREKWPNFSVAVRENLGHSIRLLE
jgi:hypothetical protein